MHAMLIHLDPSWKRCNNLQGNYPRLHLNQPGLYISETQNLYCHPVQLPEEILLEKADSMTRSGYQHHWEN